MALVLTKGETLDLTKTDNSLTKLRVGLGWGYCRHRCSV